MQDDLDLSAFWEAHDDPERPLDRYVILCACVDCETAIRNEARRSPQRPICLKTSCDRILVTFEYFVEVIDGGSIEDLLYVKDDYVREVYVSRDAWLPYRSRWCSLSCAEDEAADGRKPRRRRVAVRQSARAQARREAETRARVEQHPPTPPVVLTPFSEAIAPSRREHNGLVVAVTEWCLAEGRPIDPDLIALICAGIAL